MATEAMKLIKGCYVYLSGQTKRLLFFLNYSLNKARPDVGREKDVFK